MAEKNDVFVGNLTFNTTEDQLREKFSFVGPVKSVRILADKETGKPKGFAFVEYFDTNSALSAIKHLDGTELNGRKIKVGYPSQSNLKDIARQIGQIVPDHDFRTGPSVQNVINNMKLHEAWDALEAMKKMVTDDKRGQKVQNLLEQNPQLIQAMYEIQKRLGIVLPAHIQQQQARIASLTAGMQGSNNRPAGSNAPRFDGFNDPMMNMAGGNGVGPMGGNFMDVEGPNELFMHANMNGFQDPAMGFNNNMLPPDAFPAGMSDFNMNQNMNQNMGMYDYPQGGGVGFDESGAMYNNVPMNNNMFPMGGGDGSMPSSGNDPRLGRDRPSRFGSRASNNLPPQQDDSYYGGGGDMMPPPNYNY